MAIPTRADLLQLDVATRMDLIEELWDSIASDPDQSAELRITDEERALIDDRLAQYEADPSSSRPWSEVRAELES